MEENKNFDYYGDIECPHCNEKQNIEMESLDGLVTYHAEDGAVEWECYDCEKKFFIQEHVSRWWEVAKKEEDF